ncbi:HAD family hydrolase [Consotaella aegiceratis]|uniref:HAD family hydrolase n=1 Tax=Consotaella aegiceratis TaxID=3097961 RepID=UPI002F3EDAF2
MIIFLDVDGTYADYGVVPEAHVTAVAEARARGHRVLLCTGRPACMLSGFLAEADFDGIVAGAGAYVEVGGRVLRDERFPPDLADRAVDILDAHKVAYILESPETLHGPPDIAARRAAVFEKLRSAAGGRRSIPTSLFTIETGPRRRGAQFSKITVFDSSVPVGKLGELIGPEVATLPSSLPNLGSSAGEIFLADVHKALGAQLAALEFGAEARDVMAVGDGLNDLEVLEWAGIGVAIEGADPALLAVADRTAPGPERAGLARLFGDMGLITDPTVLFGSL